MKVGGLFAGIDRGNVFFRILDFIDDLAPQVVFPKKLANASLYKQVDNLVTVPVIEAIAKEIKKALARV
jgi:site-specific DNA-cytosine methylase